MTDRLIAATDGSARPNPGPTGWAWVLANADERPFHGESGFLGNATNNVGELTAVAELLGATDPNVPLEVRTDSQYAANAVTAWLPQQRRRGYTTVNGEPIKNRGLIVHIDELLTGRDVTFTWVKAHEDNGDPLNALADRAAQQAVRDREGCRWTPPVPEAALASTDRRAGKAKAEPTTGGCRATTKSGRACSNEPRRPGLCHIHDPAVQCGAITGAGRRCAVPTGGGRCRQHRSQLV